MPEKNLPVPVGDVPVLALATEDPQGKKLVKVLGANTPKDVIKKRKGPGGQFFTYAPWAYTARVLNQVFGPAWSIKFLGAPERIDLPDLPAKHVVKCDYGRKGCTEHKPTKRVEVMVTIALTTPWGEQQTTASHTYYPSNAEQLYGDAVQAAQSKALRRAASRWGVALDLYMDVDEAEFEGRVELVDAKTAWKSALRQRSLTQTAAVSLLSERLAQDKDALNSLDDCLGATGLEGADAYWKLIEELGKEAGSEVS